MSSEDLIRIYGDKYDELRLGIADSIEQLWLELGGPDDRRALEFAEVALDIVNAATMETAELVDAYVAEYVATVSGRPPPAGTNPLDLAQMVVDQLRGTPGLDVYRRPALETRRLLAEGKPFDQAMQQAAGRAGATASGDVTLAHRSAGVDAMARAGTSGYRRVLTGASCLLCAIASTQRYGSGELMPIHTRCDCRVAPIVGDHDGGQIVNRELYRELKAAGAMDKITAGRRASAETPAARAAKAAAQRDDALARREQLRLELAGETDRGRQGRLELRIERQNERLKQAETQLGARGDVPASPLPIVEAERRYVEARGGPAAVARLDARRAQEQAVARTSEAVAEGTARRTAPVAVATRQHGELGPVLVNDHHAYTTVKPSRAGAHRLDADAERLRTTEAPAPAKVSTSTRRRPSSSTDAPAAPAELAPSKKPRYGVDSPEVLRAARRRNVSPEKAAADLNAKAARRAEEAAAARKAAKELSVDHPDVIAVAKRNGVSPDEVLVARARVRDVRRVIAEEAAKTQATAFGDLYGWDALKIASPPRVRRGGEYDWLEQVGARERARLSRMWYDQSPGRPYSPDQLAENISNALGRDVSVDEAVDLWLQRNRTYEAAGALRRGKLPSLDAYSGQIDVDALVDSGGYDVSKVLGVDDLEAAGHIAARDAERYVDDARNYLGAAADPVLGPAPFRMSFQSWETEVRELEYAVREGLDVELDYGDDVVRYTLDDARQRLEELVPYYLDEPGTSFEDLYGRIITTAHRAGEEVPGYARVPW